MASAVARQTGRAYLGEALRESWGALLKPAAFGGRLCFAGGDGQRVRFTRPDRWVGEGTPVPADEALREVIRRYLDAHGPATREDVARWWHTTPAKAQRIIRDLGATPVQVGGLEMYTLDPEGLAGAERVRTVRLLPGFDQYVIAATKHAEALMPGAFGPRVYRPQGWISPVLCVGGRLAGVWKHERKGKRLLVEIEPFGKVPAWARRGADEEAQRLAAFLGGVLEVTWR